MSVLFNRQNDIYMANIWDFNDQEQNELDEIVAMVTLICSDGQTEYIKSDLYNINVLPAIGIVTFHCGNINDLLCATYSNGWWHVETFDEWNNRQPPGEEITDDFFNEQFE